MKRATSFRSSFVAVILPLLPLLLLSVSGCGLNIDFSKWSDNHTVVDPSPPTPTSVITAPIFRLLIVEETADRPGLPGSQQSIFASVPLRHYLNEHCAKLADGSPGWRICDKDDLGGLPAELKSAAETPRDSLPWLYVTNGKTGLSCPLPKSVDEVLEKVKAYAEGGK